METTNKTINYLKISNDISKWLKEYSKKSCTKGFVLGVSGGIDSAVVSTLCAMTKLPLLVLEMPIHQDNKEVFRAKNHIIWLKKKYKNVQSVEIDITHSFDMFSEILRTSKFNGNVSDNDFEFTMGNTRARFRMSTLYDYAGIHNLLVVGTGNKIEDFGVGFYTKYGDGGVDISPIADLMKSEVYALGDELGINKEILIAAPTDGLHEDGRTDEEQLCATYDELEWAMIWIERHTIPLGDNVYISVYNNSHDFSLSKRQIEVLKIYRNFHEKNRHKIEEIPVFKVSKFRN